MALTHHGRALSTDPEVNAALEAGIPADVVHLVILHRNVLREIDAKLHNGIRARDRHDRELYEHALASVSEGLRLMCSAAGYTLKGAR